MSIHIGVNHPREPVNAQPLKECETTAGRMAQLATQAGYDSVLMLRGEEATRQAVLDALARASDTMIRGDTLFVSFSGHGGKVIDGDHDEPSHGDGHDETWCLHDKMLSDDELVACLEKFPAQVRIVVVSESCFSAGMRRTARGYEYVGDPEAPECAPPFTPRPERARGGGPAALVTRGGAIRDGRAGQAVRDGGASAASADSADDDEPTPPCVSGASRRDISNIKASVLMLASSAEDRTSQDGVFASALRELWDDGRFTGNYCKLYWKLHDRGIRRACGQKTHIFMLGADDAAFPEVRAFEPVPAVRLRGG